MIRIGPYGINISDRCFEVGKITVRTVKKTDKDTKETAETKEEYLNNPGYYFTMDTALKAVRKRMLIDAIKDYDGDLMDAIALVKACDRDFSRLVKRALDGAEVPDQH